MVTGVAALATAACGDRPSREPVAAPGSGPRVADRPGRPPGEPSTLLARGGAVGLTASACRMLPPRTAPTGFTVVLDAGHGGRDPGVETTVDGVTVTEADLALAVVRRMAGRLRAAGHRVVLTRAGATGVARIGPDDVVDDTLTARAVKRDLEARNLCANAATADALVAVHFNSFSDPSVGGAETVYNPRRSFAARSRRLATALQAAVVDGLARDGWTTADRGAGTDAGAGGEALTDEGAAYGQLLQLGPEAPPWFRRPSRVPGAVVEPAFLTSSLEAPRLRTEAGRLTLARALASGIERYLATVKRRDGAASATRGSA